MAAAEADIRHLKESHRDHESDCASYRREMNKRLSEIQAKQEQMQSKQDRWSGALLVVVPVAGGLVQLALKWLGWV